MVRVDLPQQNTVKNLDRNTLMGRSQMSLSSVSLSPQPVLALALWRLSGSLGRWRGRPENNSQDQGIVPHNLDPGPKNR